jgi:hypothetical protein
LDVTRAGDDLDPDLVGFDVKENVEGRVVLAPQVAVAELRKPRVIPVEVDGRLGAEIAKIHCRKAEVIGDETDGGGWKLAARGGWVEGESVGAALERVGKSYEHYRLTLSLCDG